MPFYCQQDEFVTWRLTRVGSIMSQTNQKRKQGKKRSGCVEKSIQNKTGVCSSVEKKSVLTFRVIQTVKNFPTANSCQVFHIP